MHVHNCRRLIVHRVPEHPGVGLPLYGHHPAPVTDTGAQKIRTIITAASQVKLEIMSRFASARIASSTEDGSIC